MDTFAKNLRWLTKLSLAALMIAALLAASASAAVSWIGLVNGPWSAGGNWSGGVPPVLADDVLFTGTGAVNANAITNEVDANFTNPINSLWYQQQGETTGNYIHSTYIDDNLTLKIAGSVANPLKGANGNYSLIAGNFGTSTSMQSWIYISGLLGTLDVSAVGGGNTGGDIFVRETQGASSPTNSAHLDLSGLGTFNANIDQLLIGYANAYNSGADGERAQGVMYLAQSNTIKANSSSALYATSKLNSAIVVGYANHNAPPNSVPTILYLGHSNIINADDITIGGKREKGVVAFNPTMPGSSVTIRGVTAARVDQIVIGDNYDLTSTGSTADAIGVLDLSLGSANIQATSIILGRGPAVATTTSSRGGTGTLTLNAGTIDSTNVIAGDQIANWYATHNGVIFVTGGTLNVSNPATGGGGGSFVLGFSDATVTAGNGTSSGTLNITGTGTVGAGCDITDGGTAAHPTTSTILLDGGTLDMGLGPIVGGVPTVVPHNIGTANAIDSLTFASGKLQNVAGINGNAVDSTTMNKTTAGILTLDGNNTYFGNTKVSAGTLKLAATCTIANSPVIDVLAAGTLDTTAFGALGFTVGGGQTLKGGGLVNGSITVLGTLSTGESPGRLTVDGNATLSGNDLVEITGNVAATGYDQLVVNPGVSDSIVTLGGTLTVSSTYAALPSDVFWIIDSTSATGTLTGTFSSVAGMPAGWDVFYHVNAETNDLTPNSGNDVAIALVPEPAALLMLIMAAGLCLMFKRFRDK